MSSFAIQSVISTSGSSSASSSAVMVSVGGVGEGGEEGLREKSRTGVWRERGLSVRGLSVGGFCAVGVEVEGER